MMVSTNAALLDLLRESRVLSPQQCTQAEQLVGDETDTKAAARRLVKEGLLTKWQAGQLLMGSPLLSLGKYVLLDRLPWGSTHAVFLATHPMMDRKVALNVLDSRRSSRSDSVAEFLSDARAIAALDHRNLIHVFDIDEAEGRYFLVMEHTQGRNLHDVVKSDGPLPLDVAADIIRQVADGLESAHKNKLVHGGLRPTNAILDAHGTVKIIDLGLSKFDDLAGKPDGEAEDSKILGIADYLSPEQAAGEAPTAASDIYSLGCVSYWLLAGASPFGNGSYAERLQRHRHDAVPDVCSLRKDVPPRLSAMLQKMMAKAPQDRYSSARAVADELRNWWSEHSAQVEASKPKPKPKPAPPARTAAGGSPHLAASSGGKPSPAVKPPAAAPPPPKRSRPGNASPASPVVVQTKSKAAASRPAPHAPLPTKAGAGKPAAVVSAPVAAKDGSRASSRAGAKQRVPLWLILSAVGGALLLVGVAGAVTAFVLMKSEPQQVAQAGDEEKADAAAPTDGEAPAGEANPAPSAGGEDPPVEDNGQEQPVMPQPGEGEEGSPEPQPPENPDGSPDAGGDPEDADAPPAEDPPVPQPMPPAADEPEASPDPSPAAPPTRGNKKPPPAKPAKVDAFSELASAVALPPPGAEQAEPTILGTVKVPEDVAIYIDLLGGDKAAPKEKDRFTLGRARNGLADREWEFKLEGPPDGTVLIATMELKDDGLVFAWTADAARFDQAVYLRNCLLNLRTVDDERYLALRIPQQATALPLRLDRAVVRERYAIENPPRTDSIFVEFPGVGGYEKFEMHPKPKITIERDKTEVRLGEGAEQRVAAQVEAVMQKELQLTLTPLVKGGDRWLPYNQRQLFGFAAQLSAGMRQLDAQMKAADQIQDANRKKQVKQQLEAQLKAAEEQFAEVQKLGAELQKITADNVHIKFRVVYGAGAGGPDVVLVEGETAPEPPPQPAAPARRE